MGCNNKEDEKPVSITERAMNKKVLPNEFYFVARALYTPGIFKYTFETKKNKIVWSSKNERVIELSYSEDLKSAFFITAKHYGRTGAFPYIKKVRLYILNTKTDQVNFVKLIGSGMEVYTRWETDDTFSIFLNSLDDKVATYINQQKQIYNVFGKLLSDETKIYDLTSDGYPMPSRAEKSNLSPDGTNKFVVEIDSVNKYKVIIGESKNEDIISTTQKLRQFQWTADGNLVFTTADVSPSNKTLYTDKPESSKLLIYSPVKKEILKYWEGGGVKNFLIINNTLIFDTGFESKSKINMINLETLKQFNVVKKIGGCGIKYIPELPDYGK
ncbi:MAG: hypothetical protein K8H86_13700 [Ignavibacteriaceae bacterium]|nr:hypothetical protein [Ignavibacteriaceae bacterium]